MWILEGEAMSGIVAWAMEHWFLTFLLLTSLGGGTAKYLQQRTKAQLATLKAENKHLKAQVKMYKKLVLGLNVNDASGAEIAFSNLSIHRFVTLRFTTRGLSQTYSSESMSPYHLPNIQPLSQGSLSR